MASHASGARSGDQFCVYVADLLVLPYLSAEQVAAIGARKLRFDSLVKDYVQERLTFRFMETDAGAEALGIEAQLKAGAPGQAPLLNLASWCAKCPLHGTPTCTNAVRRTPANYPESGDKSTTPSTCRCG